MSSSLTGILQVYLNMSSNHTGEVVKLLTMITLITTPMTLVGTWYGMNFKNMPELGWSLGYPFALLAIVVSGLLPFAWFKYRGWM